MIVTRRRSLMLAAASGAALTIPHAAFGADLGANRFVFIILRGGMDGLSAAPPLGDPNFQRARTGLALDSKLKLDTTFALHPNLTNMYAMALAKEFILIHAAATPYRDRSHFDAQNVLETGAGSPYARGAGWLNTALAALPASKKQGRKELGLAINNQAPLVLRGDAPVATWSPSVLPSADADTVSRLMALYRERDPALANALQAAATANGVAAEAGAMNGRVQAGQPVAQLARAAAGFLKQKDGPVAAVIEIGGWDTHTNQANAQGPLQRNLLALDQGVAALKQELGPLWATTAVLIVTEFGRMVAMNGGGGTDHGTAAAAFLLGGAVKGGRVLSDWPGLASGQLYQARDLRPTTDIRGVIKSVLRDHLAVPEGALGSVFPDSAAVKPIDGLLRA